jgi:hypothetical protein
LDKKDQQARILKTVDTLAMEAIEVPSGQLEPRNFAGKVEELTQVLMKILEPPTRNHGGEP